MNKHKVFISYSHDTPPHPERVRALAYVLRDHGFDVELDQYHQNEIVDWPRWCKEQLSSERSDFVICVCTDSYFKRFEGSAPMKEGKGVFWEASLVDDDLYDSKGNRRFLPVLFDDQSEASIPRVLRGWTFCRLRRFVLDDPGYEHLLRILSGQAKIVQNPIGEIPFLPPVPPPILEGLSSSFVETTRSEHRNSGASGHLEVLRDLNFSLAGITAFHPRRSDLKQEWWDSFFSAEKQPKEVLMMAHAMSRAFVEPLAATFRQWCERGTRMRVLFLSPHCTASNQLLDISHQISYSPDAVLQLAAKIKSSIDALQKNLVSRLHKEEQKPLVRYATRDLPCSVMAVDGKMVVTLYGTQPEADVSSTLVIDGERTPAFLAYRKEFENIWNTHSQVFPHEDPLMRYLQKDWFRLMRLYNDAKPPAPRQVIFYPTYKCSIHCGYCMYAPHLDTSPEMNVRTFEMKLIELLEAGVQQIELSGGGEPTQHSHFLEILDAIERAKTRFRNAKFGLLTNGLMLSQMDPEDLLRCFDEYIRVSRNQVSLQDSGNWRDAVKRLIDAKIRTRSKCKVSAKYLLTNETRMDMLRAIKADLSDRDFRKIDYFRFTSSRSFEQAYVAEDEQTIWNLLNTAQDIHFEDRVSLSLGKVEYPVNFRCWISPISVIIDPSFDLYICCNFIGDEAGKKIGNIADESFMAIWRHRDHLEQRQQLRRENCDREYYSNCRFAELQDRIERLMFVTGTHPKWTR